jgi:hypothetical protein
MPPDYVCALYLCYKEAISCSVLFVVYFVLIWISYNIMWIRKYCMITTYIQMSLIWVKCKILTRWVRRWWTGSGLDLGGIQMPPSSSGKWGQMTCLKWLSTRQVTSATLCFGTGRGLMLVYCQSELEYILCWEVLTNCQGHFLELASTCAFAASNSVKALSFDLVHSQPAVSSHNSHMQMYHLEENGESNLRQLYRELT